MSLWPLYILWNNTSLLFTWHRDTEDGREENNILYTVYYIYVGVSVYIIGGVYLNYMLTGVGGMYV